MQPPSPHLQGLRIAAFESRRADEFVRLIEKLGGVAEVTPALCEVPIADSPAISDFVHRLIIGEIGVIAFLTGVGFTQLLAAAERIVDRQRYLHALADAVTVARGPKVVHAMRQLELHPTHVVPAPHTWRELLTELDRRLPVDHQVVAVQEYGERNVSLIAGLEARGARVISVPVYRWELPGDRQPLCRAVQGLADGAADVVLFTSAIQVHHVAQIAQELGIAARVRAALQHMVVGSIGPTTSEALQQHDWPVDLEPEHAKMGHLVQSAAEKAHDLLHNRKRVAITMTQPSATSSLPREPWADSPFMKACRCEPVPVTPVWMMRQAGRYMQEYREVREKVSFLQLCKDPGLCSEVMCTAVSRLGVDAAIVFSDLLPILEPMGFDLEFAPHGGPVIHNPVREAQDVDRVRELEQIESLQFVMDAVSQTRRDLPPSIPLIGFAGAPFTLASYAIEGGSSRNYARTKTLMYGDSGAWRNLMERLARAVTRYLNAQIAAGAQAVQLFDSWVGCLSAEDYQRYVLPFVQQIIGAITPGTPVINFATGNPALNGLLSAGGSRVVGVDWRMRLDAARKLLTPTQAIQGNLDPCILLGDREYLRSQVRDLLRQAADRPGHIFNLGHGILPQTPVDNAIALVDAVHEFSR